VVQGGSLPDRTYYIKVSFVDSTGGESAASGTNAATSTQIFVPSGYLLQVNPPQEPQIATTAGIRYDRYNIFASVNLGSESFQTGLLAIGNSWVEPTTGLALGGRIFPTTNNVAKLYGYIIEFRYFRTRKQLTDPTQILQVPDDYKDIMCAGVNWLGYKYLDMPGKATEWQQIFMSGIHQMVTDKNLFPRGTEWIRPDGAALGNNLPTIESLDPTMLRSQ
jgi:hypothetical protein